MFLQVFDLINDIFIYIYSLDHKHKQNKVQ